MKLKILYISITILTVAFAAKAQHADTVIKSNTIEIVQAYQPEIKQNPKPLLHPTIPPPDTAKPSFTYEVPQQTLFYTYNSLPLRPLALNKDSAFSNYHNYLKIGGGNLSTFYLDFGNEGKGHNTLNTSAEHTIHIHSIYQQGSLKDQKTWLTDAQLDGLFISHNNIWHLSLDLLRNQYYYYGYNHDIYQYPSSQLSQIFSGLSGSLDMSDRNISGFHYNPKISASIYGDNFKAVENTYFIALPLSYDIDTSLQLRASLNGTVTQYVVGLQHINNNILQFAPGIVFHNGSFSGYAYFNSTVGKDATYFLPDIKAAYKLLNNMLIISAGWQALLHQNTFQQLSTENPYLFNIYNIHQTRSSELFGNIDLSLGNHLSLSGRVSIWQYDYLPVFVNTSGDMKQFNVLYDTAVNAVSFYAAARYQVSNTFAAGLSFTSFTFSNGSLLKVWQVPGIRVKGDLLFHPTKKLSITAYLSILDDINVIDNTGKPAKLSGVFDVGGSIEYNVYDRLSLFAQASNLLNSKNEYWQGYTGYGFNIFGGIRFKY